ncbi:aminotransferase class V-fold PLP-dependent enzyme [Candidatus Similichlamydia epinepheli]|uniref:aminotransferase class V-fold PLP-dependent enzyme n=1 Tax=Candidatus Similichlamydia epinepheli TaxID=1903953 RepID=UPI000D3C2023|nr:cysteine desulfurase [Candidatus Similichlamydia epinepheli]
MVFVSREEFPALGEMTYLDTAATAQKPKHVIEEMMQIYLGQYASVHRSSYPLASAVTDRFELSRRRIAELFSVSPKEIVFTSGTTQALNGLAHSLCPPLKSDRKGRFRILLSPIEHHANLLPWQRVAERGGYELIFFPLLPSGEVDLEVFATLLDERVCLVSLHHVSHVTGGVMPLEQMLPLVRACGAISVVDAAQSVGHQSIYFSSLGCDFCCFSGHKVYGPTGVGVCWGRLDLLNKLNPWLLGGHMVDEVSLEKATYEQSPARFEAGTPPFVQAIGMGLALDWIFSLGMEKIQNHEEVLIKRLIEGLSKDPRVKLVGEPRRRSSIVSLKFQDRSGVVIHPFDVAHLLGLENIFVRSGNLCAQTAMKFFGINCCLRVSLGIYSTDEEIDRFIESLSIILDRLS